MPASAHRSWTPPSKDARRRVQEARAAEIELAGEGVSLSRRQAWWPAAAVILIILGAIISVQPMKKARKQGAATGEVAEHDDTAQSPREAKKRKPRKPEPRNEPASEEQKTGARKDGGSDETPADKKQSKGKVGLGKSAQAQSAGGQSSGEGAASAAAQPTKGGSKKKPKKQPKKDKRVFEEEEQEAGHASGRQSLRSECRPGPGQGCFAQSDGQRLGQQGPDRPPTRTKSSKKTKTSMTTKKNRTPAAAFQPNLRQRKPPVNRDLNIGFGGGKPPPFANGRGGPGLPKKQRGVAQLVLGVPYPDHITGQPNPGMTKVTQERIEPQASQSKQIDAVARKPRSSSMGRLSQRVLKPWMKDLVREFYSSLISQKTKE